MNIAASLPNNDKYTLYSADKYKSIDERAYIRSAAWDYMSGRTAVDLIVRE